MNNPSEFSPRKQGTRTLSLSFGLTFEDLYDREGLVRLDAHFRAHIFGKRLRRLPISSLQRARTPRHCR